MPSADKRTYDRAWYAANKDRIAEKKRSTVQAIRDRNRAAVDAYLEEHPCVDCGEDDIIVLEFDHRNPSEKSFNVSDGIKRYGLKKLFAEIAKCDVRCANCHRRRTHQQFRCRAA